LARSISSNAPERGVAISAIAGVTGLQSNQSPRQYEPVSSRRYATRPGRGILRLETAGGCDRHRPKISVSLGLILRSECASAGYVGDIQRDWKSCNIKYLRGAAERIRTSDLRTAKPRSALPLGDVACELVSRTASRPDDEQLFSSGSNPQPSPQRDGSARLAAKMNGTERLRVTTPRPPRTASERALG
jgi:hypothetical protein